MPLYSYYCDCGNEFDAFKTVAERRTADCPKCHKKALKILSNFKTSVDTQYRDLGGQKIWFPKNGKPYFDRFLGRTFSSVAEKCQYMKEKRIVMDGSSDPIKWPQESGDMRNKDYRKKMLMED
jgi:putative FmdB family regulatory protein